jgi:nitrogen regulatory protein PII
MVSKVVRALHELEHFPGVTLSDVRGQGRGRGTGGSFKITEDSIDYHKKVLLQIYCTDELSQQIADVIQRTSHTGNSGDGIIVIGDVDQVIRIRTSEVNGSAT